MIIMDESDRVRQMATLAVAGPGRRGAMEVLRNFSYSVAKAAEEELARTQNVGAAISAAVDEYRAERQRMIDYRRRNRLPVTEP